MGFYGWPGRPMGCVRILTTMNVSSGRFQSDRDLDVVLRCAGCGRRLTRVLARLDKAGGVVLLEDLARDFSIEHDPAGQIGRPIPSMGFVGDEVFVFRAPDARSRQSGQKGPRTGYREAQASHPAPSEGPPVIGRAPDPWRWSCPCGKPTRVPNHRLRTLVERALARGERDVTLR